MTKSELSRARQELERRCALTRENGFESEWCEPWIWQYYRPDHVKGQRIYQSYTDDELLDFMIAVMDSPGNTPQLERLHKICKLYLNRRFQNLSQAKAKARARKKALAQQKRWSPDWPKHVNAEPLYCWIREQGKELTEADRTVIEGICENARRTGLPPEMESSECRYLKKFCGFKKALELMNIPPLSKRELRSMIPYWKENRAGGRMTESTDKLITGRKE